VAAILDVNRHAIFYAPVPIKHRAVGFVENAPQFGQTNIAKFAGDIKYDLSGNGNRILAALHRQTVGGHIELLANLDDDFFYRLRVIAAAHLVLFKFADIPP
jgi:hypothetical protein